MLFLYLKLKSILKYDGIKCHVNNGSDLLERKREVIILKGGKFK